LAPHLRTGRNRIPQEEMVVKVCSDGRPIVERGIELAPHLRTGRNRIPQEEMVVKVCSDGRPIVERGIELAPHLRTGRNRIPQEEMVGHLGCALRVASRNLTIQHRLFWTYRDVSPVAVPPFRWDGGSYRLVLWSYLK
jgi:hypothetical protein